MAEDTRGAVADKSQRANIALALAGVALALFVTAMVVAQDGNELLWPLAGVVGLAAAITGWSAGRPRPRGRALAAVVIGGLPFLMVLGWIVVAVITGSDDL